MQAYWSWYPENRIGRPEGTATPDSSDVHITKITRPDAFDFNSTKYNCDWASLTDARGEGLAAIFTPEDRQHCRADHGLNGAYRLIVNKKTSPPRDISSSVVPDLYFSIKKGATVDARFSVGGIFAPR